VKHFPSSTPWFARILQSPQQLWKNNLETAVWFQTLLSASISTAIVVGLSFTGVFQLLEWALFDQALRLRPEEPPDPHIVIVTFDEFDLNKVGTWPIPDDVLADILNRIKSYQPEVIGLDLYRNLPVGDGGYEALVETFESTPNLYGVSQQVGNQSIGASPVLERVNRITLADIIVDLDSKVRRALLSTRDDSGNVKLSLGTQLALDYLKGQDIEPVALENSEIQLGKAHIVPLKGNDGPYVRSDRGGYQIFINYRGTAENFHTISITDILDNKIPEDLLRKRVVLIGATAKSLNDYFQTPYNSVFAPQPVPSVPGVVIHANIASELINAAINARPLIRTLSEPAEWLWTALWGYLGAHLAQWILSRGGAAQGKSGGISLFFVGIVVLEGVLFVGFSLAVAASWWLPVVPAGLGLGISTLLTVLLANRYLHDLATLDELTQVANRRSLDNYLTELFENRDTKVSLVLCDIDFFKQYNDTYGHQQGDVCLRQVAQAMKSIVRGQDLVARYGGEEFAVILKDSDGNRAQEVAERICERVRSLDIPHAKSQVAPHVTLSCGVSTRLMDRSMSEEDLILLADQALYCSKQQGRNCVTMSS
jgi:diguanylate cyclase (GGDEF)-like protein